MLGWGDGGVITKMIKKKEKPNTSKKRRKLTINSEACMRGNYTIPTIFQQQKKKKRYFQCSPRAEPNECKALLRIIIDAAKK